MRAWTALRQSSIHARIMWAMVLVAALAVAISGTLLGALQERSIYASTYSHLERVRSELAELANAGVSSSTGKPLDTPAALLRQHLRTHVLGPTEGAAAFVNGQLRFVAAEAVQLRPEKDAALMAHVTPLVSGQVSKIETFSSPTTTYMFLVVPVVKGTEHGALLHVVDLGRATRDLRHAMLMYAGAATLTLALVIAAAWPLVRRLLRPIGELRSAAQSIDEKDLTSRVTVRGEDDLGALAVAFNRMLDRVESSVRSQRDLLDDVGHELRTPITVVRGHLELVDVADPADVEAVRDLSIDELDRMSRLVNDILVLAKAGQSDFVSPVITDVADLTEQVFSKARAMGERRWVLDEVAEVEANIDASRITQAWLQLVNNAVKYSQDDSAIHLGSSAKRGLLHLWVRDHGIGISAAEIAQITQRFSRGHQAHLHAHGSGLGLSIVESIVRAHAGELQITSTPGQGSTFTMVLPVADDPAVERTP
ncbi:MAG: HAMP domain-containing sensor histidine kinase [Buchananella hordeovulneris]|nr:HAMP domain-containing sensor histidine kinase [Buchananella hordeovulneris]